MARWTALSTIAALLVVVSPAWAQPLDPRDNAQPGAPPIDQRVHFALDFQGVPGCAERGLFEDALQLHIWQWNALAPISPWPLKVRITRARGWFEGTAEVYAPDGRYRGKHTMRGPLRCYDVIAGLAVALAADATPLLDLRPKRSEPVSPKPKPEPAPERACPESPSAVWPEPLPPPLRAPEPDPPKREPAPLAMRLGASVWPELVASGGGSFGLSVEVGVRYRAVSLSAEAHGDPPLGSTTFPGGAAVSFARLSGAGLVCAHWGWFAGCGVIDTGRFLFQDRAPMIPASVFYGAAGVRAGLEFPVTSRFFVRAALDMRAPIHPVSYTFGSTTVFQTAGTGVGLGLGALVEFPP